MFIEPVFGKKFFGREEILATLHKRVTAVKGGYRQNLALTGPMLAGKSSILRHFLKTVKSTDILPVYVEMEGDNFRAFCIRFMATLLYQYLRSEGERPPVELESLRETCKEFIPATVQQIDEVLTLFRQPKEKRRLRETPRYYIYFESRDREKMCNCSR